MRAPKNMRYTANAVLSGLCISFLLFSTFATGDAQARSDTYDLDIPAQDLDTALRALALASQHKLLYRSVLVVGKTSPALRGTFTTRQAMEILLSGSGLTFEITPSSVVLIRSQNADRTYTGHRLEGSSASPLYALAAADGVQNTRVAQGEIKNTDASSAETEGQRAERRNADLGEIIVTAQKRQERLQNVPISITALDGNDLDRSSVESTNDALNRVSGVWLNARSARPGISIRGVGTDPFFVGSGPVAYYVDYVPYGMVRSGLLPDVTPYDLDRVEVLKGPQGTLYGQSALNGVVRVLTSEANLNDFEFKARALGSTTEDGGAENYRGDAAINLPIVEGKLAARAVAGYQSLSGWIDSPVASRINDAEEQNFRLKINAQPADELSVGLSGWSSNMEFGGRSEAFDDGTTPFTLPQPYSREYSTYGLRVGYEFPTVSVASYTSYLDYKFVEDFDLTGLGLPEILVTDIDSTVFSEELILNSKLEGPWRWSAGVFYRDAEDNCSQFLPPPIFPAPLAWTDFSESWAVFGELGRQFYRGALELTLGLRYFEDDNGTRQDVAFLEPPGTPFVAQEVSFDTTTPRVVLTWFPTEDLTAYASYSEGFRSGLAQGFLELSLIPNLPPAEPDDLKNYEIGAKGYAWNDRIAFSSALYYIDWQDIQQLVIAIFNGIPIGAIFNTESASGFGLDLSVTVRPTDRLDLNISYGWNDLTLDQDLVSVGTVVRSEGERLPFSPEHTLSAAVQYDFPFGTSGFQGSASASVNYTSQVDANPTISDLPNAPVQNDSMTIARASFALSFPEGRWRATVFGDNLNNEKDSPEAGFVAGFPRLRERPRTFGLQLDYSF